VNTNYKESRVAIVVAGLHVGRFTDGTMDHLPVDTMMDTAMVIRQVHLEEDRAGVEAEDVAVTVADVKGLMTMMTPSNLSPHLPPWKVKNR